MLYFQYFNSKFFPPVSETNLIRIQDPVTIVGDLHGQFYDLLKLLELGGNPEETQLIENLFNNIVLDTYFLVI